MKTNNKSRRALLKHSAVLATTFTILPEKWVKPIVNVAILPAHASTSETETIDCTSNLVIPGLSLEYSVGQRVDSMFTSYVISGGPTCGFEVTTGELASDERPAILNDNEILVQPRTTVTVSAIDVFQKGDNNTQPVTRARIRESGAVTNAKPGPISIIDDRGQVWNGNVTFSITSSLIILDDIVLTPNT